MTPYELNVYAEAYYDKQKESFKEKISLEYYNAYWTIKWLGKKKPEALEKILKRIDKPKKKVMTDEEMLMQVKFLNILLGGNTKTCNS